MVTPVLRHEPADNRFACKHCGVGMPRATDVTKRCLVRQPLTHEERQELIHRPFFITYMGPSYPWSGTIVANQFSKSVQEMEDESLVREIRREMRASLFQTEQPGSRFEPEPRDFEDVPSLGASYPYEGSRPAAQQHQIVMDGLARGWSEAEIAKAAGCTRVRVRNIRFNLGL